MDITPWIKRSKHVLSEAALIAVAATLVILLLRVVDHFRSSRVASHPALAPFSVGSQLKIVSADLSQSPISIILVSSPTCTYCLASKPFHTRLLAESERNHVPLYVAVPSQKEAVQYLHDVGFNQLSVKEWKDLNYQANATPTIVAVDNSGTIRAIWVGLLPPLDESELIKAVQTRSAPSSTWSTNGLKGLTNYSSQDIEKLRAQQRINIIDMHERGYPGTRRDAITLPFIEVPYRAPVELDKSALQIVDCSNLALSQCETSVKQLSDFRVATLNAGLYRQACKATTVD